MIGFLQGIVKLKTAEGLIMLTSGGVGYRVLMPENDLAELNDGENFEIWVHTSVREDAITLYGFLRQESYALFQLLLTVKGVGPKIALGILGRATPESFAAAVRRQDLHYLTQLPGIGKKGGERLLLELKDKVALLESGDEPLNAKATEKEKLAQSAVSTDMEEAADALLALGYSRSEVMHVLKELDGVEGLSGEEILRRALKQFARR